MSTYQLISSQVLGSSAASVTFSSIPSTYKDLVLVASARTNKNASIDQYQITFNSDSSAIYSQTYMLGNGSTTTNGTNTSQGALYSIYLMDDAPASSSNTFSTFELYIPNYTSTTSKPHYAYSAQEWNGATGYAPNNIVAGLYRNTSAINRIDIASANSSSFYANSSFYLYGI